MSKFFPYTPVQPPSAQALSVLWRPLDEVYPLARSAYERALSLDPG